jgi:hypothetical protein
VTRASRVLPCSLLGVLAAICTATPALAECDPPKPVKITAVNASPRQATEHFSRKPKVIYRMGKGKARLEEQLDPERNVQMLIVVDMPKAWYIELVSKTAQFVTDDDPKSRFRLPVISDDSVPPELLTLEYGCEAQFVADPKTTHESTQTSNGLALKHSQTSGPWKLTLATRAGSERPVAVVLSRDGKVETAIQYVAYETLESIPDAMFAPPAGVKVLPAGKR